MKIIIATQNPHKVEEIKEIANLYVEEDPLVMNNKKIINVDLVDGEIEIIWLWKGLKKF